MEELLVCGICYDYMETSVMTPCSHNCKNNNKKFNDKWTIILHFFLSQDYLIINFFFPDCSLCIRKYLHYKTQCPACFEKTFEKDLHTNRILDEIIIYFSKIRDKLVNCIAGARKSVNSDEDEISLSSERPAIATSPSTKSEISSSPPVRPARTSQLQKTPQKIDPLIQARSPSSPVIIKNNEKPQSSNFMSDNNMSSPSTSGIPKIAKLFTPKSFKLAEKNIIIKKQVSCPVCSVEISDIHINKHLDACLKRERMTEELKTRKIENKRKPLPKLVIKLMKDSELKKKMKEYNLPIYGDRKTLELRFQKYCILYNAECDKENPRNPAELVRQLDDEENTEKKNQIKNINIGKLKVTRYAEQNVIEVAQKNYLEENKQSFQDLINSMKKREKIDKSNSPDNNIFTDNEKIETSSPVKDPNIRDDCSELDNSMSMFESGFQDTSSESSCPLQRYTSDHPVNFLSVEINENAMSPKKMKPVDLNNENKIVNIPQENLDVYDQTTDVDSSEDESVAGSVPGELQGLINHLKKEEKTNLNDKTAENVKEIQAKKLARSIADDFVVDSSEEESQEITPSNKTKLSDKKTLKVGKENGEIPNESIAACRPVRKRNFPSRFSSFETPDSGKLATPTRLGSIESLQKEIDENQATEVDENGDNSLKRRRRRKCTIVVEENKNQPRRPIRRRDMNTVLQDTQK